VVELRTSRPAPALLTVLSTVLATLTNGAITFPAPPPPNDSAGGGVGVELSRSKESWSLWRRCQQRLQNADRFLAGLLSFEPLHLSDATLAQLKPLIQCEQLTPEAVGRPARPGAPLPPHSHAR
jgi:hypothetical protein